MKPEHPWAELAKELGAEVHRSWHSKVPIVQWRVADTLITAEPVGDNLGVSTLVRAIYLGDGSFRFSLRSARVSTELGKLLFGTQDILVGDKSFDRRFEVRGSDEARTRAFFGRPRILELLKGHWSMSLAGHPMSRRQNQHFRGDLAGLSEIVFGNRGILSAERLGRIFELFHEILIELGLTAPGDDDDVEGLVSRLRARGGTLHGWCVLWDGDLPRRRAAESLGQLQAQEAVEALMEVVSDPEDALRPAAAELLGEQRAPEAVEALMEVLSDPDDALRLAAVEALGRIGDARAVPAISALLGDRSRVEDGVIAERAAAALEHLGAGDLVEAFHEALQGRPTALRQCVHRYRASTPVAHAFVAVMGSSELSAVEAAAHTLGWLGVRDVIPDLRDLQRMTGWDRSREACREAIAAIESTDSLPRPAHPEGVGRDGLPKSAGAPNFESKTLPRAITEDGDDT